MFAASRAALALLAYVAQVLVPPSQASGVWLEVTGRRLVDGWLRWDSGWYLIVAGSGYVSGEIPPVLPLYPALIRLVDSLLPGQAAIAALLVSNAAFAGALVLVYRIAELRLGSTVALRVVLLLSLFPFSYFYAAAYADPVTLLLAAGAFLRLERAGFRGAFALAALAALTTPSGQALWPALLISFLARRRSLVSLEGLSALLAPLAVVGFGAYLLTAAGASPSTAVSSIAGPARYSLPRDGLSALNPAAFTFGSYGLALLAALVLGVAALLTVVPAGRLLGVGYALFALLVVLRPLVGGLDALGRDLIVAFPAFVVAGSRIRTPRAETLALIAGALFLGLFTALFASWHPTDRLSPLPSPTKQEMLDAGLPVASARWPGVDPAPTMLASTAASPDFRTAAGCGRRLLGPD